MRHENPIEKRIKRHVIGREKNFFAATAPGLEKSCFDELMSFLLSAQSVIRVRGGVEFKGRVHDCYLANLNLRTAGRILMRVDEFKASSFLQLEKKLVDFPWELFLYKGFYTEISVTARHSRLYHKEAISERFKRSIANRLNRAGMSAENKRASFPDQKIFIRVVNDRFTVSIDSSGELLYRRGIKKHGGRAPIRETIAAAILKVAGYDGIEPLIDPMCGSGTFSIEGAMMVKNMPAGWFRGFAFMGWPCFRPNRWAYIRREAEERVQNVNRPIIFASDSDKKVCDALTKTTQEHDLSGVIKVMQKDFFDLFPSDLTSQTGLVVINPPYGLRMGTRNESRKMFYAICEKLGKDYSGWKVALVATDKKLVKKFPFKLASHNFFHGGLKLTLLVGRIP